MGESKSKRSTASYSAASRKAWRTRKKMKAARKRLMLHDGTAWRLIDPKELLPNPWLEMKFK